MKFVGVIGNTYRLTAEFKTFGGIYADPQNLEFKVFDEYRNPIGATVSLGAEQKVDLGIWFYDLTIPDTKSSFITSGFSGELEGSDVSVREKIFVEWVKK